MRVYVGVGTNLGDRWGHLAFAARELGNEPRTAVLRASRVWDTAPMGPPQPRYLNAVLELETTVPAPALLETLLAVEDRDGRTRAGHKWSARTLDLDLLLYGADVVRSPALVVPHPGIVSRRFVLEPLAELAPDLVVPGTGQTVAALLHAAPAADVVRCGLYPL